MEFWQPVLTWIRCHNEVAKDSYILINRTLILGITGQFFLRALFGPLPNTFFDFYNFSTKGHIYQLNSYLVLLLTGVITWHYKNKAP